MTKDEEQQGVEAANALHAILHDLPREAAIGVLMGAIANYTIDLPFNTVISLLVAARDVLKDTIAAETQTEKKDGKK